MYFCVPFHSEFEATAQRPDLRYRAMPSHCPIKVKLLNGQHKVSGTHMPLSRMQIQRLFSIVSKRGFWKIVKRITHHSLQESALNVHIQVMLP